MFNIICSRQPTTVATVLGWSKLKQTGPLINDFRNMIDLYRSSAREVVANLKSGDVSIADTLDCLQQRIKAVDPLVNALPTLCFERARKNAAMLEEVPVAERGILCGLPVTIKDLTSVGGVRTTFGSALYRDHIPDESDQLVERIERHGGVIYAKSNTPEFGTGGITFNDVFGITRSPHDLQLASGGSSGGAAASLASGCAWLSHGSDMAGSLRTPAGFCGVTSLRPSPGTIPADSLYLPFDVLGADGPMARDIQDLGLFADAMRSNNNVSLQAAAEQGTKPMRVAVSPDLGIASISDEVRQVFNQFVEKLASDGIAIEQNHPELTDVHDSFDVLRAQSFAVGLELIQKDDPGIMKPEVEWNIEQGISLTSEQIRRALRSQGQVVHRAANFMREYDLLICPATSVATVPADLRYPGSDTGVPVADYYRWLAIAYATTMTSLPIITLPCGQLDNGIPVGIQLVGKPGDEYNLFRYARVIEELVGRSALPIDPM